MRIDLEIEINCSPERLWQALCRAEEITAWNFALDTWHCPTAQVDLRVGGKLQSRMEAKDGSMGFDFEAVYTRIEEPSLLEYTIADGRPVLVEILPAAQGVLLKQSFEAEDVNSAEMQKQGWLSILKQLKSYVEQSH